MRVLMATFLALLVAGTAFAGTNPDVRVYLDFDESGAGVHRLDGLTIMEIVDVYVVLDCLGEGSGTRGLGFTFEREGTLTAIIGTPVNLLGGLSNGNPESPTPSDGGCNFLAGGACVYPDVNGVVVAGYVPYTYVAGSGYVKIGPNTISGRQVLDCDFNDDDDFCVYSHVAVDEDPPAGDADCDCDSPVELETWGAIKGLFR